MAFNDEYTYTDPITGEVVRYYYKPRPAQANAWVAGYAREDALKREDDARAEAARVTSADKIDYAESLRNYESRPDAELFANRRAREYAVNFEDQDFARETVDIAGAAQSSDIGTTSVADGTQDLTDDRADLPFQPVLSNGDDNGGGSGLEDSAATTAAFASAENDTANRTDSDGDGVEDDVDTADDDPATP